MIKNFENYTKVQHFSNRSTQWTDGHLAHSAKVCVDDIGITRALVREAFQAQEAGVTIGCFQQSDVGAWHHD